MPEDPSEKTKLGLGDILGAINDAGGLSSVSPMPQAPADPETLLRRLAEAAGADQNAAMKAMRQGGPLARVVCHLLDIPPTAFAKPKGGRPPDDEKAWLIFRLVVWNGRRLPAGWGHRSAAIEAATNEWEAIGQRVKEESRGWPDGARRARAAKIFRKGEDPRGMINKAFIRAEQRGWCEADVPSGLAGLFTLPPRR